MPITETSSAVRQSLRLSMTAECTAVAVAGTLAGMGEGTVAALAQYALPGIIVVSALGAFIMCLQVFRYGFTAGGDEDLDDAPHRLFVTRFAHALAALCFASAAMLAVLALKAQALLLS